MFSFLAEHFSKKEIAIDLVFLSSLILAWLAPEFGKRVFGPIEKFSARLAQRRHLAILFIALVTILVRVSLLEFLPVPVPRVHDEFSYLLAADTFAHGRLTNPPHPMWIFFDTFHVNQHPTYISKYPPAQGMVLALGQRLGHPWIGVLLSCALMCAAVLWALQGWLPGRWALLGAAVFSLRIGVFSYWMNSYWGGAVAATGGALVVGAFPRILRRWKMCDAALMGLGALILANSRPFEGLIFCIPIAVGLIASLWRKQKRPAPRVVLLRFVVPLVIAGAVCGGFMTYYNFRGTGHPFLSPYTINDKTYLTTPIFVWGTPPAPFHHTSAQLDDFYNGWSRSSWFQGRTDSFQKIGRVVALDATRLTYFFLWPELCVLLLGFMPLVRGEKFRFVILQLAFCTIGFAAVPWFYAHYAAPLSSTLFIALSQSLRHVRHWEHQGRLVGMGLSRAIASFALILSPLHYRFDPRVPSGMVNRDRFSQELRVTPGEHLVIVRYSNQHDASAEWVYNGADIDHEKVVWAREIPGVDIRPLLHYFHDRRVWLVQPDLTPPHLVPYPN